VDNATVINTYGYNARSELTPAAMGSNSYAYAHDAIGHPRAATNDSAAYTYSVTSINHHPVPRSTTFATVTCYPCYEPGENISDCVDTNATVVAHRAYDPFRNALFSTGPMKKAFNFRLSSKYLDPETGLYYYGLRYYNPSLGRWLSRDPIGERGGIPLYGFVGNSPTTRYDLLGLIFENEPCSESRMTTKWGAAWFETSGTCYLNARLLDVFVYRMPGQGYIDIPLEPSDPGGLGLAVAVGFADIAATEVKYQLKREKQYLCGCKPPWPWKVWQKTGRSRKMYYSPTTGSRETRISIPGQVIGGGSPDSWFEFDPEVWLRRLLTAAAEAWISLGRCPSLNEWIEDGQN
jgi:RHS repeat-associated protein